MTKIFFAVVLALTIGCKAESKPTASTAPKPADVKYDGPRNLALDHALSEVPDAKCVVYYQHEGQLLTDSAKCTLPDKTRVYVQVDVVNGPKVTRSSPPTEEEVKAMQAQQAAQAAQAGSGAPPAAATPTPAPTPPPTK